MRKYKDCRSKGIEWYTTSPTAHVDQVVISKGVSSPMVGNIGVIGGH